MADVPFTLEEKKKLREFHLQLDSMNKEAMKAFDDSERSTSPVEQEKHFNVGVMKSREITAKSKELESLIRNAIDRMG